MKIQDRIKKFMNRNNPELIAGETKLDKKINEKANEIEKLYVTKKENGEENPINDTVEKIMQIVQNNPDPLEVRKLLTELIERENISDQVVERAAIELSKKEDILNHIIVEAIDEAETSIPDSSIKNIINKGDMNIRDNLELIQQMHDQEKQKQAEQEQLELQRQEQQKKIDQKRKEAKTKIEILKSNIKEMQDGEIGDRISAIQEQLGSENMNNEINELIQNIIAQRMAEDIYNDARKNPSIYKLSKAMSTGEMIERDLATTVQEKYKEIEEERGHKEGRFNKREFKMLILNEMARQISIEYEKTGLFDIPESKQLSQLKKEEKKYLVDTIQNLVNKKLKKEDILEISRQINEGNKELQKKENQIINLIRQIPIEDKSRIIDVLNKMIVDKNSLDTIEMLDNEGLLNKLTIMPTEKRKETINIVNKAVGKRNKYKVATKTPKTNGAKFSGNPTSIEYEER